MSDLKLATHFRDFRYLIIKSLAAVLIVFGICWFFKEELWLFFKEPIFDFLNDTQGGLIFINPLEKFFSYVKVCFWGAFVFSSPYWMYEFWKFLSPALYKKEKIYFMSFLLSSLILFFSGLSLCYYLVAPSVFDFLLHFGDAIDIPMITMKAYLSFLLSFMLLFGFIFQIPLVLGVLGFLGIISCEFLKKYRKIAIVFLSVFSMLFTPPDVFSMIALFIPLCLLYEFSILIVKLLERKKS